MTLGLVTGTQQVVVPACDSSDQMQRTRGSPAVMCMQVEHEIVNIFFIQSFCFYPM